MFIYILVSICIASIFDIVLTYSDLFHRYQIDYIPSDIDVVADDQGGDY